MIAVLLAVAACSSDAAITYTVDWGVAPEALHYCDTLLSDGDTIEWSGTGCKAGSVQGEAYDDLCSLYEGEGFKWWICQDVDESDRLVGELIVDGQVVADFSARQN